MKNLKTEKEKNISLNKLLTENDTEDYLLEISKYFEVKDYEEIPNKLKEMINFLSVVNNNNEKTIKNEFIENLKEIYRKENNIKETNNEINMKLLWRWVKYLINSNKKIKNEISKNAALLNNIEEKNIFFKQTCEEIMDAYNFKSINQFEEFIQSLINKKNFNKKRMDQLKKILSEDSIKNNKIK